MLTFPLILAVITAGALGGVHCIGMCGGLSVLLESEDQRALQAFSNSKVIPIQSFSKKTPVIFNRSRISRHSGRLLVYAVIGGLMGGLGTIGMQFRPILPLQQILYILGNIALIALAFRLLEFKLNVPFSQFFNGWLLKFDGLYIFQITIGEQTSISIRDGLGNDAMWPNLWCRAIRFAIWRSLVGRNFNADVWSCSFTLFIVCIDIEERGWHEQFGLIFTSRRGSSFAFGRWIWALAL